MSLALENQDIKPDSVLKREQIYVIAGIGVIILIMIFAGRYMAINEVKK